MIRECNTLKSANLTNGKRTKLLAFTRR